MTRRRLAHAQTVGSQRHSYCFLGIRAEISRSATIVQRWMQFNETMTRVTPLALEYSEQAVYQPHFTTEMTGEYNGAPGD